MTDRISKMLDRLKQPMPEPPHLSLDGWEHKGKNPTFDAAIAALEKSEGAVTEEDRKAVATWMEQLRERNLRGSQSRLQHFQTNLEMNSILGRNPVARMISNNLHAIPDALDAFAKGEKPIGELQQPAIGYIMRWSALDQMESAMYETHRRAMAEARKSGRNLP